MRPDPRKYLWDALRGYATVDDTLVWQVLDRRAAGLHQALTERLTHD
ncbi:MAG: hypothetical protein M3460_23330 [Actinomycetota bacterium]|nr:hypothetical protein [Actinomycetota bacterium]